METRVFPLLAAALALLAACSKEAPPPPPPQAAEVTALMVKPQEAPVVFEFVGQTESSQQVEIRARVVGFLEKRVYTEGAMVKAGQLLFLMDRKPFEAALQAARSELAQQQARLHWRARIWPASSRWRPRTRCRRRTSTTPSGQSSRPRRPSRPPRAKVTDSS